ncbi:MAG: tagaturonate reductase [Clostridiales bacterium]|nr:tagaturonate reductase [Clostridiales bacterium]
MLKINQRYEKTFSKLPVKVLQIGEGNFLRAFADWIVESANRKGVFNGSVIISQPIEKGMCEKLNEQDCMYTVLMRGKEQGKTVERFERITSVSRCINPYTDYRELIKAICLPSLEVIISNTTEAGIAYNKGDRLDKTPQTSYPAKLTALLYKRYLEFNGDMDKGLLILPVELIERNGDNLKMIVHRYAQEWALGDEFTNWLQTACGFANTLVDRIVTGFPSDEYPEIEKRLGYEDKLLVTCEPFLFWVIECDEKWIEKFPVDRIGLNIIFTDDMTAYRTRKVRILNGAHTASVLAAYHCGCDTVLDMMNDTQMLTYITKVIFDEIVPNINLPASELDYFARAVIERFENPFIKHRLLDISLNSVSKFKARCLESLLDYKDANGSLPPVLTNGLAALIYFYKGRFIDGKYIGGRNEEPYEIRDNPEVLSFMAKVWGEDGTAKAVLGNRNFWDMDLNTVEGLTQRVGSCLALIESKGMKAAVEAVL